MAKLTIITVVKDYAEGFARTAASIRAQKNCDFKNNVEWIVVNGSTMSNDVARQMDAEGDVIAWSQSQPDQGIYDAMNIGIDRATGDYLWFLNAGDTAADPDVVARTLDIMEQKPGSDFIYGDFFHEQFFRKARPVKNNTSRMATMHQAMLFKRNVVGDQRYDLKYKISSDLKFSIDYLTKCQAPVYIGFPLARFETGGVSDRKFAASAREAYDIRKHSGQMSTLANMKAAAFAICGGVLRRTCPQLYPTLRHMYDMVMPRAQIGSRSADNGMEIL